VRISHLSPYNKDLFFHYTLPGATSSQEYCHYNELYLLHIFIYIKLSFRYRRVWHFLCYTEKTIADNADTQDRIRMAGRIIKKRKLEEAAMSESNDENFFITESDKATGNLENELLQTTETESRDKRKMSNNFFLSDHPWEDLQE